MLICSSNETTADIATIIGVTARLSLQLSIVFGSDQTGELKADVVGITTILQVSDDGTNLCNSFRNVVLL